MNKTIKEIIEFTGATHDPREHDVFIMNMDALSNSIESTEEELQQFVNLKTLEIDKNEIKDACDYVEDEERLLRETKESVKWLKQARKHFSDGVSCLKEGVKQGVWRDSPGVLKIRNAIFRLKEKDFFEVYRKSTWL